VDDLGKGLAALENGLHQNHRVSSTYWSSHWRRSSISDVLDESRNRRSSDGRPYLFLDQPFLDEGVKVRVKTAVVDLFLVVVLEFVFNRESVGLIISSPAATYRRSR